MNEYRFAASSVVYRGNMIVTGGVKTVDGVEELILAQSKGLWIIKSQLPFPRIFGHVCVVYKNRILLIGGYLLSMVYAEIYEIQLTPPYTSRLLINMPQPRCYHGAVLINEKIFITGGSTTGLMQADTNTVLVFDPATNTCTELKPLPYAVSHMATVAWKDNVAILGGSDEKCDVRNNAILYNVTTGSHRTLPNMRKKRVGCTAVTIGDNIIVMGGCDETGNDLNSVECYNFGTNTWTEFPAMAEARSHATAVVHYM
jgi:N-acetylneuraminic acid mutarotase